MKKNKKIVIIIISIIILFSVLIGCFFISRTIQLDRYISNEDFVSAGNIEEKFYNKHSKKIMDIINKYINNNELQKGIMIYEKLFNYVLSSNNIDYDADGELWYKYQQIEGYLSQELKDMYWKTEYKYIVEQSKNNSYDERTTYALYQLVFDNEKYIGDKETQYSFLKTRYEEFKNKDTDCRISELSYIKDCFIKLGDFEKSSEYVNEIDKALKWQGSWVGFGGYKNRDLYQVAINYYNKKVYTSYITSPVSEEPRYYNPEYGTAKFEFIDDNNINVNKESGYPIWNKATISLENDKIIYSYERINNKERIELSRETDKMNFEDTATKLLQEHPYQSSTTSKKQPQIGMSASEVRQSTWGYPDKINKDTYSWGTTEQWVYKNKGYIYFRNGIVTSISER